MNDYHIHHIDFRTYIPWLPRSSHIVLVRAKRIDVGLINFFSFQFNPCKRGWCEYGASMAMTQWHWCKLKKLTLSLSTLLSQKKLLGLQKKFGPFSPFVCVLTHCAKHRQKRIDAKCVFLSISLFLDDKKEVVKIYSNPILLTESQSHLEKSFSIPHLLLLLLLLRYLGITNDKKVMYLIWYENTQFRVGKKIWVKNHFDP